MPKSHKRQSRPIFPPAWTVAGLSAALGIKRTVIDEARRSGELGPFYKIGLRSFVLTESVISWIKSHRRAS